MEIAAGEYRRQSKNYLFKFFIKASSFPFSLSTLITNSLPLVGISGTVFRSFKFMAECLHPVTHKPQPIHLFSSTTAFFSISSIAFAGQRFLMHFSQPVHFAVSENAVNLLGANELAKPNSNLPLSIVQQHEQQLHITAAPSLVFVQA